MSGQSTSTVISLHNVPADQRARRVGMLRGAKVQVSYIPGRDARTKRIAGHCVGLAIRSGAELKGSGWSLVVQATDGHLHSISMTHLTRVEVLV